MAGTGNLILKRGVNMPYDESQDNNDGSETTPVLLHGMPAAQMIGSIWGLTTSDGGLVEGIAYENYPNRFWIGTDKYAKDNGSYTNGAENIDTAVSVLPYTGTAPTHPTVYETRPLWMGAEIRAYTPLKEDTSGGGSGSAGAYVILKADWDRPSDFVLVTQKAIATMPLRYWEPTADLAGGGVGSEKEFIEFSAWDGTTNGSVSTSTQYLFPSTAAPTVSHVLKIQSVTAASGTTPQIVKLEWASAGSATGTMSNFVISADTGTDQTVDDAETIEFAGGTGIDTVASATNTITFNLDLSELTTESSPAVGDLLSGVDVSASNVTRNFTIGTALGVLGGDISVNTSTGSATVSATNVKAAATTDNTTVLALLDNASTTAQSVKYDTDLTYDASSNTLSVTNLSATTITGTVSTATNANNINISSTDANSSDSTTYLTLVAADSTGNQALHIDSSRLTYNALTQNLIVGSSNLTQGKLSTKTIETTEITRSNNTLYLWTAGGSGVVIGDSATGSVSDDSTKPVLSVDYRTQSGTNRSFVSINGGDLYLGRKAIPVSGPTYTPVNIIFDGTTLDATNRTTLTAAEPSAARTVTIPDASGTIVLKDGSNNIGAGIINDLVVGGNLTVSGTTTTVNTETVTINDNIIVLNNNETGTPSQNAGIEVERGTSNNVSLLWSESSDKWSATIINSDVSTYPNTFYPMVIADSSSALHAAGTEGSGASGQVTFNGTISGTNLTTTSVSGKLTPGMYIFGSGITAGTSIVSQTSGTPEGAGVYVISTSHTIGTSQAFTAESGRLGQQYIHTASIKYLDVKNLVMSGTWTLNASINSPLDLKDGGLKLPYLTGTYHTANAMSTLAEGQMAYNTASDRVVYNRGDSSTAGQDESGNTLAVVVDEDATQTLSNKTLTAPKIVNNGFIADANGNEQIKFVTTGSAINEITITNAASGSSPLIASSGDDSNIDLKLQGKGTGTVLIDDSAINTSNSIFGVFDATALTVDAFGAATTLTLGHDGTSTSTTNIVTGVITTGGTKTINIGTGGTGGTTNITLGANTSGTTAINSQTLTAANATTVNLGTGAASATTVNIGNASNSGNTLEFNSTAAGTVNVTTDVTTGTVNLFNTNATTVNIGGAATTALNLGYSGTSAGSTTNISTGAVTTGTKTINIGTGAAAGNSTTTINVGGGGGTTNTTCSVLLGCPSAQTSNVYVASNRLVFSASATPSTANRVVLTGANTTSASVVHTLPNVDTGNVVIAGTTNFNTSGYILTGGGSTTPSAYTDPDTIVVGGVRVNFQDRITAGARRYPVPFLGSDRITNTSDPATFGTYVDGTYANSYLYANFGGGTASGTVENYTSGLFYEVNDADNSNKGTLYCDYIGATLDCGTYS